VKAEIQKYQAAFNTEKDKVDSKLRKELILKYAPLVKYTAERIALRLPPHISVEDLEGAGVVGLLEAIDKFDFNKGIKFQTYAEHRIKGAMLDELRKMDWTPRSVREGTRRIEDAMIALRARLGREPEDHEVAEEMGIDIEAYYRMLNKARGINLLSFEAIMEDNPGTELTDENPDMSSPVNTLKKKELTQIVSSALSTLPEKEQLIISLYYYDELTLKEIAKVLGLTESRISQIHSKTIISLRAKLRSYYEGGL